MSLIPYKGFLLNSDTTPPNWAAREVENFMRIIDWLHRNGIDIEVLRNLIANSSFGRIAWSIEDDFLDPEFPTQKELNDVFQVNYPPKPNPEYDPEDPSSPEYILQVPENGDVIINTEFYNDMWMADGTKTGDLSVWHDLNTANRGKPSVEIRNINMSDGDGGWVATDFGIDIQRTLTAVTGHHHHNEPEAGIHLRRVASDNNFLTLREMLLDTTGLRIFGVPPAGNTQGKSVWVNPDFIALRLPDGGAGVLVDIDGFHFMSQQWELTGGISKSGAYFPERYAGIGANTGIKFLGNRQSVELDTSTHTPMGEIFYFQAPVTWAGSTVIHDLMRILCYSHNDNVWTRVNIKNNNPQVAGDIVTLDFTEDRYAKKSDIPDVPPPPIVGQGWLTIQRNGTSVGQFNANATGNTSINIEVPAAPTVGNGQLTIQRNGVNLGTFSANQTGNNAINIEVPSSIEDVPFGDNIPKVRINGSWEDWTAYIKAGNGINIDYNYWGEATISATGGGGGGGGSVSYQSSRALTVGAGGTFVALGAGTKDYASHGDYPNMIPATIRSTYSRCDIDFMVGGVTGAIGAGLIGRLWRFRGTYPVTGIPAVAQWVAIGTQFNIGSGSISAGSQFSFAQTGLDLQAGDRLMLRITATNDNWGSISSGITLASSMTLS